MYMKNVQVPASTGEVLRNRNDFTGDLLLGIKGGFIDKDDLTVHNVLMMGSL